MLQTIREHTQGWIAGTIVSIIILSFALWGIHSYFIGGATNTAVARINGVEISKEQLTVAYERLRRQAQTQYGTNLSGKDDLQLKNRALQNLIDINVLKQASWNQGFRVSDRQIDNYLQSMSEFQVDGRFSVERFQEILSSTMLSTGDFLDLIETSLLIDQPRLGVIFTSFSLADETNRTVSLVNQERDIDYVNIPAASFLTQPIIISTEKIQTYYDQHKNDFLTPEQMNVEYIELALNDLAAKIVPTDTMLKSFYNENINAYTQPMQWKLTSAVIPLAQDASPEQLAQAEEKAKMAVVALKRSDHFTSDTPADNRLINWLSLNQVPAEFQKAVAEMTKPGQVSEPVRTLKGYVVLKVVDIKGPKMQSFEEVKNKVRESYVRQHAEEKFAERREELANLTYEHPDSLQLAAKTLNLPIKNSELFTKDKGGKDISQYKKVRTTAFSNDVLSLQNNSDVIQVTPETAVVLRVKSHVPSTLLPLKDITRQIEDKLKNAEAEARAAKFAEVLQEKLETGADPIALANAYKLKWNNTGFIGRYSNKVEPAILDKAFSMPNPTMSNKKLAYGVSRLPNGYAVVVLKSVKLGAIADKKQQDIFAEQVQNSVGLLEYELYKLSQTKHAKIKIME